MAKKPRLPRGNVLPVPNLDRIARYCSPSTLDRNGSITGVAFQLRHQDESLLSVEWVECISTDPTDLQLLAVRRTLASQVASYSVSGRVAYLNVAAVRQTKADGQVLNVKHWPTHKYKCHTAIDGLAGLLQLELSERLAELGRMSHFPA